MKFRVWEQGRRTREKGRGEEDFEWKGHGGQWREVWGWGGMVKTGV